VFDAYINDYGNKAFSMICLQLTGLTQERFREMASVFFYFNEKFFKDNSMFRIRDDKFVLVYEDAKNVNAALIMPSFLEDFKKFYSKYKLDYKIVVIHSSPELSDGEEYILLNDFLDDKIPINTYYECTREDVKDFMKANYIVNQLHDIRKKNDLEDERVKVYCQPVLNLDTGTFTSAEALMRLELPDIGLVYPDVFIPLAEKNDCIHTLSMIILNKTCRHIKALEAEGYEISRISVNFAMSELKLHNFCDEVKQVINDNGIPYEQIAVELTESMNESEFENVKHIMSVLHSVGMMFYLDDFGTGYSNIERIIKLPIDIIKFDRSLTIMASNDENSKHIVEGFTDIFNKSDYKILFEGVETESDEQRCRNMNALYLQGYKYSKPIPIENLRDFLTKRDMEAVG
jgi:EAL domain-containing protein (putative c-di-GMP-specific phosphodiesterase class I)